MCSAKKRTVFYQTVRRGSLQTMLDRGRDQSSAAQSDWCGSQFVRGGGGGRWKVLGVWGAGGGGRSVRVQCCVG